MTPPDQFLENVYDLDDPDKTHEFYRQWARTYDDEMRANGYASPDRVAEAMSRAVTDKSLPLLDLGCGTGLSGEALVSAGFTTVDGSDFSDEMLAAARTKNVYRRLVKGDASEPIRAGAGDYGNVTAVGVFSPGHAPPDLIDHVLALLPPGGCFGFTLNDHALEEEAYEARIEERLALGDIDVAFKDYGTHLPKAGIKSMVYVLRNT